MAGSAPTRLGPYEIVSLLGKGGMGEVWKAHDPRLGRDVAIKVSAQQFTDRFEREARAIAKLNHTNICTLFDVGPNYLVMELIDGPTLDERIKEGPIPLEEALAIAKQIADALEAAHEKGIVHRDLKPANIKIRPDGSVKVLDFGLAKGAEEAEVTADSPTVLSVPGMILGTAGYMSPEQARGQEVDKRADIWAFGVVLYEMATGKRLFDGATVSDVLAAILLREPDLALAPEKIRRPLQRCLEKDPRQRLRDIGDVWLLLDTERAAAAPSQSRFGRAGWIAAGAFALVAAALAFVHFRGTNAEPPVTRTSILPPDKAVFAPGIPAISPDGRHLAFAATADGKTELWVRDLDSLSARLLPGTEGGSAPFWSPDSRSLAFFATGKLKRIDLAGGAALTLCDAMFAAPGSWSKDDVILFTPSFGGLFRVSASGGTPTPATTIDPALSETVHFAPWFMPDGRHFLYTANNLESGKTAVTYEGTLGDSRNRKRILAVNSQVVYTMPGYLLFARDRTLMAQPFDVANANVTGEAVPVAPIDQIGAGGGGEFSVSQNGVLVYSSGSSAATVQLTWFDRSGKANGTVGAPGVLTWPAISPDGATVAFDRQDPQTGILDIWLHSLKTNADSRFTFGPRNSRFPVWSPDSSRIAFMSESKEGYSVSQKATDGVSQGEVLDESAELRAPTDWSQDGRYIIERISTKSLSSYGIGVLPLTPDQHVDRKLFPYLQEGVNARYAKLSPGGQWLAYASDESKRAEVYVQTFPNPGGKWQVSANGGDRPIWSRDGKELFFISADQKLMSVEVKGTQNDKAKFEAGVPKPLFDTHLGNAEWYDVGKDGRFLIPTQSENTGNVPLTVVVNWATGLKK